MAYNEQLAERLRKALVQVKNVQEKKMFGALAFMVNKHLCITAGEDRIMCRIDPALHAEAITKKGCRTVIMKGRAYKGYVHVDESGLESKAELGYWVKLALDFNQRLPKK